MPAEERSSPGNSGPDWGKHWTKTRPPQNQHHQKPSLPASQLPRPPARPPTHPPQKPPSFRSWARLGRSSARRARLARRPVMWQAQHILGDHVFLVGRVPGTKIDHRKKGTLILTSLLEDLDNTWLGCLWFPFEIKGRYPQKKTPVAYDWDTRQVSVCVIVFCY